MREENERLRADKRQTLKEIVSDTLLVAMKRADAAEARIKAALALHTEWGIYDECDHTHTEEDIRAGKAVDVPEVGFTCDDARMQTVCRECHTDDGEPTEDTEHGEWPCPTVKALRGEENSDG
jgi:hypothetical protein